jgi:hypothetical protein
MKRFLVLAVLIVSLYGCADNPLRFAPTEAQKQAIDLTVTDSLALAPHVDPAGQPILTEATDAAKITQTYLGLPTARPTTLAAGNATILGQAATVAAARPTPAQTVAAGEKVANDALGTVTQGITAVLALVATGAGIYYKLKSGAALAETAQVKADAATVVGSVDTAIATLPQPQQATFKTTLAAGQAAPSSAEQLVNELQAMNKVA